MYPWYIQLAILLGATIVAYPIIVIIVLKYFYFPMLMQSVVEKVFSNNSGGDYVDPNTDCEPFVKTFEEEEKELEDALTENLQFVRRTDELF